MPRNLTCTSASSARPATRGPHAGVSDARPRRALALLAPLALALGVSLAACAERGPDPAADAAAAQVPGNLPATSVGPVDPTSVRDKLAGSWVVRRAGRVVLEFSLDGDRIALTDRRFPAPRQLEGAFRVRSDTGFGVETADGTTYWYSAAWVGSDVHIGLGTAIAVESLDRFTAHLGAWERLERTPEACVYVRTWGPNATRTDVPCEVTERGGRQVFTYEAEDPFRPDRLKKVELDIVGPYLMDRELAESLAVPRVVFEREAEAPLGLEPADPAAGTPLGAPSGAEPLPVGAGGRRTGPRPALSRAGARPRRLT